MKQKEKRRVVYCPQCQQDVQPEGVWYQARHGECRAFVSCPLCEARIEIDPITMRPIAAVPGHNDETGDTR